MRHERRQILRMAAAGTAWAAARPAFAAQEPGTSSERRVFVSAALARPVLRRDLFPDPLRIESLELLQNGRFYLVRVRAAGGASGLSEGHGAALASCYPILLQRVAPYFLGKDARDLEALVDGVYVHQSNYKWQGLPLWVGVAAVELALLDLLGQVSGKPIGELLGGVRNREFAVYWASSHRGNRPEEEVEYLRGMIERLGSKAVKFRLGGRMSYDRATTRRDRALIPLARKALGDAITLYADANGSYDVPLGIEIGRLMQEHGYGFLEEPVPFDHYEETRRVAEAIRTPVAGGECESSLRAFRSMIEHDVVQVVQPDLLYFGGLIRSMRVARMAEAAGIPCTPHLSGGGLGYLYVAHFASCLGHTGPYQEYKGESDESLPVTSDTSSLRSENGRLKVPTGPGLGIRIDPTFVNKARLLTAG
jgi:L-alanine-DL-glutamate epimerase-like enolase superfamily enzyme